MVVKSSGAIAVSDVAMEFGVQLSNIRLSQLYRGSSNVPANSNAAVPAAGEIGLRHFYGAFYTPGMYRFDSPFTFTTAGTTGSLGPNLQAVRSAYASSGPWVSRFINMTTNGVQLWTVPRSGAYSITAAGAKGGDAGAMLGGKGRCVSGTFTLTMGNTIKIVVGQAGQSISSGFTSAGGTGGGGTYVVGEEGVSPIILIGGGGGGAANNNNTPNNKKNGWDAPASQQGTTDNGDVNTATPGGGGALDADKVLGGAGGYSKDGKSLDSWQYYGKSFINGSIGGETYRHQVPQPDVQPGGGFGGGAGVISNTSVCYTGGGGGYTGGDSADYRFHAGGGGGSFLGTSYSATGTAYGALNNANGYVTVAFLG